MTVLYEFRRQIEEVIRAFLAGGATTFASVATFNGGLNAASLQVTGRVQETQGTNVASTLDMTLPTDGNSFVVTGANTIQRLSGANNQAGAWQDGSLITLVFAAGPITLNHNTAPGGALIAMMLSGNVNWTTAAGNATITFRKVNNVWFEIGRKA